MDREPSSFGTNAPAAEPADTPFHPAIRAVYAARLGSGEAADRFLAADPRDLPQPQILPSVAAVAQVLGHALDRRERIAILGASGADGIAATAVLLETLEYLGAAVDPYVPAAEGEGNELSPELVRRFQARNASLLVALTASPRSVAEAGRAAAAGLPTVLLDHRAPTAARSIEGPTEGSVEVANPKTDPRTAASHGDLTTSGVAALVARDLLQRRLGADADKSFFRLLDLVALGTVAEGADVSRTNRTLVVQGLSAVGRGNRPAIELARRALAIGPDAVLRLEKTERLARVFASIPSTEGSSHGLDALLTRSTWAGDTQALLERFLAAEKGAGEEGPAPETSTAGSPAPEAEGDLRRGEVDAAFSRSLRAAMPFGRGNPSPLFRLPDYREGSLATRAEEAGRSTVDLMESGFPPRSEGQVPLVTFLPKGRGGLVVRFEGWAPGRRER